MPLRSVKMKRFIFGFQRRVWCPKCTPLSSSCFMDTTWLVAMVRPASPALPRPRRATVAAGRRSVRHGRPAGRRVLTPAGAPATVAARRPVGRTEGAPPSVTGSVRPVTACGRAKSTRRTGRCRRVYAPRAPARKSTAGRDVPLVHRCRPGHRAAGEGRQAGPVPLHRPALVVLTVAATWGWPVPPAAGVSGVAGAGWGWPLDPVPVVVAPFVAPAGPFAAGHRGVDLAAAVVAVVRAAGSGTVAFAGPVAGRPVVSIDHPGGLRTTYEPVTPVVARGDRVARGDPVGTVAAAPGHCLPATCLHWGLRRGETYLDPLALVGIGAVVRLLPMWAWSAADQPLGAAAAGAAAAPGVTASRVTATASVTATPGLTSTAGRDRRPDRGPLLVADRLRAGRAGRPRGAGSRRARCRRGRTGAGTRAPPRR